MNVELTNDNHSVFAIRFHLTLAVKYRKKAIDDGISERPKGMFGGIGGNCNIALEEWNHDINRVHVLFRSEPDPNISKSVNAYKPAPSRLKKRNTPPLDLDYTKRRSGLGLSALSPRAGPAWRRLRNTSNPKEDDR